MTKIGRATAFSLGLVHQPVYTCTVEPGESMVLGDIWRVNELQWSIAAQKFRCFEKKKKKLNNCDFLLLEKNNKFLLHFKGFLDMQYSFFCTLWSFKTGLRITFSVKYLNLASDAQWNQGVCGKHNWLIDHNENASISCSKCYVVVVHMEMY